MTHSESRLAELSEAIRLALADWDGLFEPGPTDIMPTIAAGERMAGVLCRVQIIAETVIREQTKKAG